MGKYDDCVLRKNNPRTSKLTCQGLKKMLCLDGVKCPFYGSNKELYLDNNGFVRRKEIKK